MKIVNSVPQSARSTLESGESLAVMYYNNMGIMHFMLRKHHLGAFYLRKAIHENGLAVKEYNAVDPSKEPGMFVCRRSVQWVRGMCKFKLGLCKHLSLHKHVGF